MLYWLVVNYFFIQEGRSRLCLIRQGIFCWEWICLNLVSARLPPPLVLILKNSLLGGLDSILWGDGFLDLLYCHTEGGYICGIYFFHIHSCYLEFLRWQPKKLNIFILWIFLSNSNSNLTIMIRGSWLPIPLRYRELGWNPASGPGLAQ